MATITTKSVRIRHVRLRKRSLHEAVARKGRKIPNRTQKRNNKNVFRKGIFQRGDTVRYKGKIGFVSGFTGTSGCYITDMEGNYISNPAKSYRQVSLKEVTKLYSNKSFISQYVADSSPTFAIAQEGDFSAERLKIFGTSDEARKKVVAQR